jgi:hypothetical protein
MIKDVHIGATMHLKGSVTYTQPDIRCSDTDEYPVIGGGEVVITYGDSWKVKRVGRLRFTVDGKTGYKEEYWMCILLSQDIVKIAHVLEQISNLVNIRC